MSTRPRILYVSTPWLYGWNRGLHVARALRQVGEVDVLIVDSEDLNSPSLPILAEEFTPVGELRVQPRGHNSWRSKLMSFTSGRVPFPHGIGVDEPGHQLIRGLAEQYDLIWFFKYRTANMFRQWAWPRSVLDIDDLPSGVYRSVAESAGSLGKRIGAQLQIHAWQRRERLLGERFSVLATCSDADKRSLTCDVPVHVIPNGFSRPSAEPRREPATPPRIGFIGLFDYAANVDGVRWFIDACWPRIRAKVPGARLRLVGQHSRELFASAGEQIDALGWVDNSADEIATWSLMVVPLRIGGGQRVKIAEGFSRRCPVVSTRLGAFGYELESGRELLLADQPDEFADACISLILNPGAGTAIADRAFTSFLEKWTWDAIAPRVQAAADEALRRQATPSRGQTQRLEATG